VPKNFRRQQAEKSKQSQAKKAEEAVTEAKPRATISLGFINFGQTDDSDSDDARLPPSKAKMQPKIMDTAPRGVPTLYNWRTNRDGSITGYISGTYVLLD
jgi:hypothetical protein